MSCLPIVNDRAETEGSKYFELGQQAHDFFNLKYLFQPIFILTALYAFGLWHLCKQYGFVRLIFDLRILSFFS